MPPKFTPIQRSDSKSDIAKPAAQATKKKKDSDHYNKIAADNAAAQAKSPKKSTPKQSTKPQPIIKEINTPENELADLADFLDSKQSEPPTQIDLKVKAPQPELPEEPQVDPAPRVEGIISHIVSDIPHNTDIAPPEPKNAFTLLYKKQNTHTDSPPVFINKAEVTAPLVMDIVDISELESSEQLGVCNQSSISTFTLPPDHVMTQDLQESDFTQEPSNIIRHGSPIAILTEQIFTKIFFPNFKRIPTFRIFNSDGPSYEIRHIPRMTFNMYPNTYIVIFIVSPEEANEEGSPKLIQTILINQRALFSNYTIL